MLLLNLRGIYRKRLEFDKDFDILIFVCDKKIVFQPWKVGNNPDWRRVLW